MDLIDNFTEILEKLYGKEEDVINRQIIRYNNLFEAFNRHFTNNNVYLFSTPGRTEISGNHTDHNLGQVIAASIDLDSLAIVAKNDSHIVTLYSEGYEQPFIIDLNQLSKIDEEEGTTNSLIKGIASRFVKLGYNIGGFSGVLSSDVLPGSGLSSSASIEVLIGNIFNSLFNNGDINNEEIAKIGQYAENIYFGKPCGLMDQMACAIGGIIAIDFKKPDNPKVEKIEFKFEEQGYKLLIVDTGGNHEDLTEDYSSIPKEMKSVAKILTKDVCREFDYQTFFDNISPLSTKVGDRAILRVFHFLQENERVVKQTNFLKKDDFQNFLKLVNNSGDSSFKWLQNIYSIKNPKEQSVTLALALTEKYIKDHDEGACRIHGGGFAGTIQVYLPNNIIHEYKKIICGIYGESSVKVLSIRNIGSVCLNDL